MKTLLILLLPVLSLAQTQFPDTLFLVDGRSYPCLITSISDDWFYFDYPGAKGQSIIKEALQNVSIDKLGKIYNSEKGFVVDEDIVMEFIDNRSEKMKKDNKIREELNKFGKGSEKDDISKIPLVSSSGHNLYESKKWSFGILYVPYYSGTIYEVIRGDIYYPAPQVYAYSNNQINIEAQLAYGINNLRFTFDAGYTSSFNEERSEYHYRNDTEINDGYKSTLGLKLFDFNLGIKYYFGDFITEGTGIYAEAGFGKQIAFAQNEYKLLYPIPGQGVIKEDNIEEFTEELNSPWHFNIGFGAEYFFNSSLSLKSNIRLLYTSSTGKYNSRYVTDFENRTYSSENTFRNFSTKIGIGLNYYF